jgi:hypothetical protein
MQYKILSSSFSIAILLILGIAMGVGCKKEETAVTPSNLSVTPLEGRPGTLLTIRGKDLDAMQTVLFGTTKAIFNPVYNTDSILLIRVPENAEYGSQVITLTNLGGEATKATIDFKVLQPPPIIDNFTPTEAAVGELVTINGKVFDNLEAVHFGDVSAEITASTKEKIEVKVPVGVLKGRIIVTTSGGKDTTALDFSPAGGGLYIYDDLLQGTWQNWSWGSTIAFDNTDNVKIGTNSLKLTNAGWGALQLNTGGGNPMIDLAGFTSLKFWIHGGADNDKKYQIAYRDVDNGAPEPGKGVIITARQGEWTEIVLNLSDLGSAPMMKNLIMQEFTNAGDQGPVYIDELKLQ